MPIYRVMVEGRDFPGRLFDEPDKTFGFFSTRWCEADDEHGAELAVIDALRDAFLDTVMPLPEGELTPSLHLKELERVEAFPDEYPETGATWFPMDD